MSARSPLFSRRTLFWLVVVGAAAFFGSIALLATGGGRHEGARRGGLPDAVSALGHRAFVRTLKALGVPVVVSRFGSARKARGGVLFVAEPPGKGWRSETRRQLLAARRVIVVLPKWRGLPDRRKPGWVAAVRPVPIGVANSVLAKIESTALVHRPRGPVVWDASPIGPAPTLVRPQLIRSSALRPIVSSSAGMLVGEARRGSTRIWIVADPDIFANHGIGKGGNARLALGLIEALRPSGGAVVVDATVHGLARRPSLWRAMFELPFVVGTAALGVAMIVMLWAGAVRFGAPRRAEPPLEAGKVTLIDNTTRLLQFGGHQREILDRYRRAVVATAAALVHAPASAEGAERAAWLDRVGAARGTGERLSEVSAAVDVALGDKNMSDRRLVALAARLYRWRREMIDGPR